MKIKSLFSFLSLFLLISSTTVAQYMEPCHDPESARSTVYLSLDGVLDSIRCENLHVLLRREKVEEVLRESYIVRSALFPQINASASQERSQQFINLSESLGGSFVSVNNNFRARLEGSASVLDTRKIADYMLAKKGYRISQYQYETILQDILAQAANAYYLHERNLKRTKVLDANIKRDEFLLDLAKARFDAGVAQAIDVTRAEVQLSQDKKAKLQHQSVQYQDEINLKLLLDINLDTNIEIQPVASEEIQENPQLCRDFFQALQSRSDYHESNEQLSFHELESTAALLDYVPKLNLSGNAGYASLEVFDSKQELVWNIGATLSMPIFDGFRIFNDKFRADALVRAQKYAIKDLSNKIDADLRINKQKMDSRFNQIILTRDQVMLGNRELELASERFQQGVADNQEIILAQTNLAQFLDDLVNTVYLFDLSRVEWARSMGDVTLLSSSEN